MALGRLWIYLKEKRQLDLVGCLGSSTMKMGLLNASRLELSPRAFLSALGWSTMRALHLPSALQLFALSWPLLRLKTSNYDLWTSHLPLPMVILMRRST